MKYIIGNRDRQHPRFMTDADIRQAIVDAGACACRLMTSAPEVSIACIRSAAHSAT